MRTIPARTRQQKKRLAGDKSLSESDRQLLMKVPSDIHYNDTMYNGDGRHYFSVGLSAVHCIDRAVTAAKLTEIQTALDLPCGHGRVLRFLVHRFPQTKFTACDLDRDGVDCCERMFAAEGEYSSSDLNALSLRHKFDLIWCGSLVTHLDKSRIKGLLSFFSRQLSPGGLVVFTAAGDRVVEWMSNGQFDYGIAKKDIPRIRTDYVETGYGYCDYPYMTDYGISLTSPDWIQGQVKHFTGLRQVFFEPHAWDDHQDVYGFVNAESKGS